MSREKQKRAKRVKDAIRRQVARHVANAFPGCAAVFIGQQSNAALKGRTFGFRVRDLQGKYRSNIIWVDSGSEGEINEAWVEAAVRQSNG
jgi:hypothetical protein